MSLLELKLTLLEDVIEKMGNKWESEYISEHWKIELPERIRRGISREGVYIHGKRRQQP